MPFRIKANDTDRNKTTSTLDANLQQNSVMSLRFFTPYIIHVLQASTREQNQKINTNSRILPTIP